MLVGQKVVLIPRGDRTRLMASEVPLMYGMVTEVVRVGVCEGEFRLCEVWEWRWMKVAGYPFWARALVGDFHKVNPHRCNPAGQASSTMLDCMCTQCTGAHRVHIMSFSELYMTLYSVWYSMISFVSFFVVC